MPFWQSSAPSNRESPSATAPRKPQDQADQMSAAQLALTKARRNLLGAGVLLLLAFFLIPWVLDKAPRAWGDDVILNMPKANAPYVKLQGAANAAETSSQPVPMDSTTPIKPSEPVQTDAAIDAALPNTSVPAKVAP